LLIPAVLWCLPLLAAPEIAVPTGSAIELDGRIDAAEWADAFTVRAPLGEGKTVILRLKRQGPWLALAVSADRGYRGEILRFYTTDSEQSWLTALFFGIGQPAMPPLLWRRGSPGAYRTRELLPECPRACRARVSVAREGDWAAEFLVRVSVLGVGRGDRRTLRGMISVIDPSPEGGTQLTLPKDGKGMLSLADYATLVSPDGWGREERWAPIATDVSREFDDNELLYRLYLEHDRISARRPPEKLVISDAVRPLSDAKVTALRGELDAARARNPTLPAWDYFLGRLLHESNHYAEARKIIEAIPPVLSGLEPFVLLAAEHYLDTEEWARVVEVCKGNPAVTSARDIFKAARRGEALWESERAARERDATKQEKNPRVRIVTSKGAIVCELFEDEAPMAVRNFIRLVQDGFYDRLRFHGVQGGAAAVTGDPRTRPGAVGERDNPGWALRADKPVRPHLRGTLATVVVQESVSHGSQFVIATAPLLHEGAKGVTVFGRVVEGLDVLDRIEQDDRIDRIEILLKRNHAYDPLDSRIR